jgi:hypothetical protein
MVSENENSLHAGALTENVDIRLMATINTDMSHLTPEEKSRFRIGKMQRRVTSSILSTISSLST